MLTVTDVSAVPRRTVLAARFVRRLPFLRSVRRGSFLRSWPRRRNDEPSILDLNNSRCSNDSAAGIPGKITANSSPPQRKASPPHSRRQVWTPPYAVLDLPCHGRTCH